MPSQEIAAVSAGVQNAQEASLDWAQAGRGGEKADDNDRNVSFVAEMTDAPKAAEIGGPREVDGCALLPRVEEGVETEAETESSQGQPGLAAEPMDNVGLDVEVDEQASLVEGCGLDAPEKEVDDLEVKDGKSETELSEEEKRRERLHNLYVTKRTEILKECARELLLLIPENEWGMPMTMWVVRGGVTAESMSKSYAAAAGSGGIEKQESTVWNFEKKLTAAGVEKVGMVVFVEQSNGAREVAKALLLAGRFVVWVARNGVEQYARENARGVVDAPSHAEQLGSWLRKWRGRGGGMDTPSGGTMEARLAELAGNKAWPVSIEAAVDVVMQKFLERNLERLLLKGGEELGPSIVDERSLAQVERCYGFVCKDYPDVREGDPMSLDQTTALATDTREALERLVRRLRLTNKGRGVLLHGLPGTGKTMLAKVVAIESGRTWVEASYANWQACEHLGEHLAAMASSFSEAIDKAPSVMFIDELDSIGKRDGETRNASYKVPVINAMLEWVQEAIASNVVVIGATNYPDQIDAALVRPGRLGEWIEIGYPGKEQRAQLIAKELPGVGNAMAWASRIGRTSPAKIMELVHEARERSKERGAESVEPSDLEGSIEGEVRRNLRGRSIRALGYPIALGLCAKAWMIKMAYPLESSAPRVVWADTSPGIEDIGRLELEGAFETGSGDLAWARLQVALASAAARVASARLAGSLEGLGSLADLDQLDREQARACLQELSSAGLASPSGYKGGATWLDARNGVDELANAAWAAALASLDKAMPVLTKAAKELERRGAMSGAELMSALGLASGAPKSGWAH